jgi:hypothetical protein
MSNEPKPDDGITTGGFPQRTTQPETFSTNLTDTVRLDNLNVKADTPADHQEFVISANHRESGQGLPVFIVRAKDEPAARKMCQRNYLVLQSIRPFVAAEWEEKPRVLPFGPPISGKDFERDYWRRGPERGGGQSGGALSPLFAAFGFLFCGPVGAVLAWMAGKAASDSGGEG